MKTNIIVENIIEKAMVLEHQFEIDVVCRIAKDSCEAHGFDADYTNEVVEYIECKLTALQDFRKGIIDCKAGIYDKWYRYNRKDDGAAYDKGWMRQNKTTMVEHVEFIKA